MTLYREILSITVRKMIYFCRSVSLIVNKKINITCTILTKWFQFYETILGGGMSKVEKLDQLEMSVRML